jgi:uncharacterized protein (TIGR02268 family)
VLASLPLMSALLAATPGVGVPPSPPDCEATAPALELSAGPGAPAPVLCISPGLATNLLLDTSLPPGAVEVQATQQELRLAHAQDVVTLVPSAQLVPGEWRKLTVRYGDGAAPAVSTLLLYVHPVRAARQVEVRRLVRTVASYQREVQELREQAQRCEEESAHLREVQGKPDGLRGLLSAGLMGQQGIAPADLLHPKRVTWQAGSALEPVQVHSFRSEARVAVELKLELPSGGQPWAAEDATLEDTQGEALNLLPLWQEALSENTLQVIVEAEAKPGKVRGSYKLKLKKAGDQRSIIIEGVVFPPLPAM